jgi:hypothetical protein
MLSAVARTASSFERGAQLRIRFAFSFVVFFTLPSSGREGGLTPSGDMVHAKNAVGT